MKKLLAFSISFVAAMFLPLAASGGTDFSGELQTFWGVSTPWASKENWQDSDIAGRFLPGSTSFTGTIDVFNGNSSALAEGSVSYDACTGTADFSLDELWLDYSDSFWGLRIGRQKTAWGKADGIDITNVICPDDMSSFAAMTGNDSKLAIDAVRLSFSGNLFTADAYWIPFFTPAALPLDEGNGLRKYLVPSSVEFPIKGSASPLSVPVLIGNLTKPEATAWNGEYGLKLSGYFSALDISLYGFYGWDDTPVLDYTVTFSAPTETVPFALPESVTINGSYKRMGMIGADAAIPIKETVLRLETAFFPERHFQKTAENSFSASAGSGTSADAAESSEKHNQISALAGLDWMPAGWTITAQYYCDYVFGNLDIIERDKAFEHGASLSISKSLLNETLDASAAGLINFNDFDSLLNPAVTYSLSDQISLSAGSYIFLPGPENDGKYGKYKDLTCAYISAKFSF